MFRVHLRTETAVLGCLGTPRITDSNQRQAIETSERLSGVGPSSATDPSWNRFLSTGPPPTLGVHADSSSLADSPRVHDGEHGDATE